MGDDGHGAAAAHQVLRQPVDGLHIQMVGRLVEQQELGLRDQRLGQRHPSTLATRHRADHRLGTLRERRELHATKEAGEHVAHGGISEPRMVGTARGEHLVHRRRLRQGVALRDEPQVQARLMRHAAGIGLIGARQELQERRLAVAVATHDPHAVARGQPKRDAAEDLAARKAAAHLMQIHQVARGPAHPAQSARNRARASPAEAATRWRARRSARGAGE